MILAFNAADEFFHFFANKSIENMGVREFLDFPACTYCCVMRMSSIVFNLFSLTNLLINLYLKKSDERKVKPKEDVCYWLSPIKINL